MQISKCLRFSAAFLAAVLTLSAPAIAQGPRARSGEVAGVFGWESLKGIDDKTHVLFGASGGFNASERVQVFGEYTYLPLGSMSIVVVSAKGKAHLIGGGIRVHFGGASSRVNPFVVGAGGFSRATITINTPVSPISASGSGGYFGGGGGVSLFLGRNWGVRPEARFERLQWSTLSMSSINFPGGEGANVFTVRASLFFQFGGR